MNARLQHPVPLDSQLCFSLYGASMAMGRVYKPMLDRLGITYPQYLVLQALWEEDDRTIGRIAERLSLEASTITPLVKRLAAAGLVERNRDPSDERQVRVALTDRGRTLQADSQCVAEGVFARTGLTVAQMAALTEQIQALRRALAGESGGMTAIVLHEGDFGDPDGTAHGGLNERWPVKILLDSRDYLYRLMKIYGDQPS